MIPIVVGIMCVAMLCVAVSLVRNGRGCDTEEEYSRRMDDK